MKKIISLFKRDYESKGRLVIDEVVEGAEWVVNGEGVATHKFDGTCCMVSQGKLFKRYDAKKGKTPPGGFIPAQDPDPISGHWPGWIEVGDGPDDRWFREAWNSVDGTLIDGTYELVGPKVQSNPEKLETHALWEHGSVTFTDVPRTFEGLKSYLEDKDIEGIVWHHPDGRMVKIKKKDFGFKR